MNKKHVKKFTEFRKNFKFEYKELEVKDENIFF